MKLLFDQNISFRILKQLRKLYPEARHVSEYSLISDRKIWNYAKEKKYSIITFDADFYELAALLGHPPKIVWLRLGNTSTPNLVRFFEQHFDIIKSFLTDKSYEDVGCLEIDGK